MEIMVNTLVGEETLGLEEQDLLSLARCYQAVFNYFWQENWTEESARREVEHILMPAKNRSPILTLAFCDGEVIGFSCLIMTDSDHICLDDMPFSLPVRKKEIGLKAIRYWLQIAEQDKILIYRELGIKNGYHLKGGRYMATRMSLPMTQAAVDRGYNTLFYWTDPSNVTFRQCLGMDWHPVLFYPEEKRVVMKGSARSLARFSRGILDRDPQIFQELKTNKQKYFCR